MPVSGARPPSHQFVIFFLDSVTKRGIIGK
jgi:hypothetical protein